MGSHAWSDAQPDSDVDVLAVSEPLSLPERAAVVRALTALKSPARGLEFVLYTTSPSQPTSRSQASPIQPTQWQLNLNTGPRMPTRVAFDPKSEPSHWFVLDVAMARERAIPLHGPPPSQLFAPIPQHQILQALEASLDWHAKHQPSTPNAILNACRAWHYTQTARWSSKSTAATWALQHVKDPAKIRAALAARNRALGSTS